MRAQASSRLCKQGKSSDPPTLHPPPHTHTPSHPLTHFTNREGQPGPGRGRWPSRPWGSQGLWPVAASGGVREGGQDRVAVRATLRLRARMTEQADILATGNKSPRQHSQLPVPRGWCPRASWSEQRLCLPCPHRREGGGGAGSGSRRPPPSLTPPTHPAVFLLSCLPVSRTPSATTCP